MAFEDLNGKSILVTGGTGSFGQRCIRTLLEQTQARRIIVFSRDELKQSQMQASFKDVNERLRFFLGDVRDLARLNRAFNGVDIVIHAAALKQVPALEYNPSEAIQTNIIGTQNVVSAAIDNGVERVLFISSDKAANPANLYGATKLCGEKVCISSNVYSSNAKTKISVVRYGNVLGSRGSILKIIDEQKGSGVLTLTHEDMTRFWITLDQGIALVLNSIERMMGGEIFIPKLPSMRVKELLLTIAPDCELRVIGIRPGEKMHEVLLTPEESRHAWEYDDCYVIYSEFSFGKMRDALPGGRPLQQGFTLASNKNERWLDAVGLKRLLDDIATT